MRLKKLDKDNEAYAERKEKMMDEKKKQEALKLLAKSKQREAISEKLYKVCLVSNMCICLCICLYMCICKGTHIECMLCNPILF